MSLDELPLRTTGVIAHVEGEDAVARRLADLGFVPGTAVVRRRNAPLGDPIEFELRGVRLCLRRAEAARIVVTSPEGAA